MGVILKILFRVNRYYILGELYDNLYRTNINTHVHTHRYTHQTIEIRIPDTQTLKKEQ